MTNTSSSPVTDAMVERAWAAIVGTDVAGMCFQASIIRADLRTALEAVISPAQTSPSKEDFAKWSRVWHDTCETILTLLGLPAGGSPQELLAQVQAHVSIAQTQDDRPVEVWNGERKVTVYSDIVLRIWGLDMKYEMSEAPRSHESIGEAFKWLFPDTAQTGQQPVGWFYHNDYHGYQQVAKEFEGEEGQIPLYADATQTATREALEEINALISNGDRPTVNERNAFEHFTTLNRLLLNIRDIARRALSSAPSTLHSPSAATIGDTPPGSCPPASAAMGRSAGAGTAATAVRDATEAMALAGARSIGNTIHTDNHGVRARECWRAMWDARDGIVEPIPQGTLVSRPMQALPRAAINDGDNVNRLPGEK